MTGKLWRMKKAAYGLVDASRKFWQEVMDILLQLGCRPVVGVETLLYYRVEGKLEGLICLHVDDILAGGSVKFKENIMNQVEKRFACSKREINSFRYTGVDIERTENGDILTSQQAYVDNLEEYPVDNSEDNERLLSKEEFKKRNNTKTNYFVVAGGVAANKKIREMLINLCKEKNFKPVFPPKELCGDNAAMIAMVGLEKYKLKKFNNLDHQAIPRWQLDENANFMKGAGVKL